MSIISSFRGIENQYDVYKGKDCMEKCCESLREHTMEIITFKKRKMKLLTNEQQKSYQNAKICYICKEKFQDKHTKDKSYCKVKDHCHYPGKYTGAAEHSEKLYEVKKKFNFLTFLEKNV